MAEGGEEGDKIGWPYTSVDYLNRAGRSRAARKKDESAEERAHSPWVGLSPMEGACPTPPGMSTTADEIGESYPETLPCVNPELISRPAAPVPGSVAEPTYPEQAFRPIANPMDGEMGSRQIANMSPETVTLYPRPDDRPLMFPGAAGPPPGYTEPFITPPIMLASSRRQADMVTPSAPIMQHVPSCVGDPYHHARHTFHRPPPEYGRAEGHITMGRGNRARNNTPFRQRRPGINEETQTASGVKPMFLKPQSGPAGLPDARVQCPQCLDDRWYVDIVTENNPCIDDPISVLDSRMKCLTCAGDVWQVDLFTTRDASRTRTPISPPQIHRIDRVVTPSRGSPSYGQEPPQVVVRPYSGGNPDRRTPDSGYGSRSATPRQRSGDRVSTPAPGGTYMSAAEWVRRSRAIRRLMFESGIPDAWGGSEM